MPSPRTIIGNWARSGVAILCLLFAASASTRTYAYFYQSKSNYFVEVEPYGSLIDLGEGIFIPRSDAKQQTVPVYNCEGAASIYFVPVGPYAPDPSIFGAPKSKERVSYYYHGWNFGDRFVTVNLNTIYFTRKAYARIFGYKDPTTNDLAVKMISPSECESSPQVLMSILRLNYHSLKASCARGSAECP